MSDFERILAMLYTDPDFRQVVRSQGAAAFLGYALSEDEVAALLRMNIDSFELESPISVGTSSGRCTRRT